MATSTAYVVLQHKSLAGTSCMSNLVSSTEGNSLVAVGAELCSAAA